MRTRRYNYYALAQPGVLFNAPEGEGGGGAGGDATATAAAAQAATDAATKTATDAAAKTATDAAAKTAADAATAAAQDVKSLPDWAQKVITDARKDAGDSRTAKNAADATQAEFIKALAKAAGVVVPGDAPLDPAELAKKLETTTAEKLTAVVHLAVFKAAMTAGANPVALLDRTSFTKAIEGLDPTKADFGTKVTAAITTAVAADPGLKAAPAAARSGVNFTGGTGEGANKPQTLDQALAGHYGT